MRVLPWQLLSEEAKTKYGSEDAYRKWVGQRTKNWMSSMGSGRGNGPTRGEMQGSGKGGAPGGLIGIRNITPPRTGYNPDGTKTEPRTEPRQITPPKTGYTNDLAHLQSGPAIQTTMPVLPRTQLVEEPRQITPPRTQVVEEPRQITPTKTVQDIKQPPSAFDGIRMDKALDPQIQRPRPVMSDKWGATLDRINKSLADTRPKPVIKQEQELDRPPSTFDAWRKPREEPSSEVNTPEPENPSAFRLPSQSGCCSKAPRIYQRRGGKSFFNR